MPCGNKKKMSRRGEDIARHCFLGGVTGNKAFQGGNPLHQGSWGEPSAGKFALRWYQEVGGIK